jgi:hypothetical protein
MDQCILSCRVMIHHSPFWPLELDTARIEVISLMFHPVPAMIPSLSQRQTLQPYPSEIGILPTPFAALGGWIIFPHMMFRSD